MVHYYKHSLRDSLKYINSDILCLDSTDTLASGVFLLPIVPFCSLFTVGGVDEITMSGAVPLAGVRASSEPASIGLRVFNTSFFCQIIQQNSLLDKNH